MRLDPLTNPKQLAYDRSFSLENRPFTYTELLSALRLKNVKLTSRQDSFFVSLNQSKKFFNNNQFMMNALVYRALLKIVQEPLSTAEHINQIINVLVEFEDKNFNISADSGTKKYNLMHFFCQYYLCYLTSGKTFHSVEAMDYLHKLVQCEKPEIFCLFYLFTVNSAGPFAYNANFLQTTRRVFYFSTFLENLDITLPLQNNLDWDSTVFSQPEGIMGCLSMIKNEHPKLLTWTGNNILQPPQNLTRGKEILKYGYSFLHKAMLFNYHGPDSEELFLKGTKLSAEEKLFVSSDLLGSSLLEKSSGIEQRAAFLRYLAVNIADDDVVKTLAREADNLKLKESKVTITTAQWTLMVRKLLKLPQRLENFKEKKSGHTQKSDHFITNGIKPNLNYPDREIDTLFEQLLC